ncbi:hypothetical protein CDD81_4644 [Ophiocordyceps australis]|uniref:DNA damage-binding protein 1 n=1 Tax=Ophiocordyceps australis TaxID=1399860 RepID=A0A2C5Y9X6_9HYPO|nr:hypothetical protein CDD81_4644 [Ophiocordyceps australis]
MSYFAPVHRPTSIRHALSIRLLSPDHQDLVVAKTNRLEIWRISDTGMTCLHSKVIFGTIIMLQRLQPKDSPTDLLFVGTDRQQYFNISWNPQISQLEMVWGPIHDTAEPYMRPSQSQNKCLVDPTGMFMAMHLWEGVINVFRLPTRKGQTKNIQVLDQVRLTELWMKSSIFLHSRTGHPRIAFLYKTQLGHEEARIAIYRLTRDDKGDDVSRFDSHKDRELDDVICDPYASMLIPVPVVEEKRYHVRNNKGARPHLGGVLVVGETVLTYFDSLTYMSVTETLPEPKLYVAWAEYDGICYFLADDYGCIDLLTIETVHELTGVVITGMSVTRMRLLDPMSHISRASNLVYMGNNLLFLASHHGDSQLLRVNIVEQTMAVVQTLSNNAPILDFTIMDMGSRQGDSQVTSAFSSGQARIVAGCGAYNDGSLRSIRSGVGLHEDGVLDDIVGTRGLFALRSPGAAKVDMLVVSSIAETRILRFDANGGIEEVFEFHGMILDQETLLAANLDDGSLLQVTPHSVRVLSMAGDVEWALLAVEGTTLVSLNLLDNLATASKDAEANSTSGEKDQISCLHAARSPSNLGVVGWWSTGTISIVDLATLEPLHGESLRKTEDSASIARDIALVQLHPPNTGESTLLVALEDGSVVTFRVTLKEFCISGRKSVTLGSSPARLHILAQDDGTCNVFATTEHASLIYSSEGRIVFSATSANDATYVVPFDSVAFPKSVLMATDSHLQLCRIDKERLTHVKTLPLRETVRRVAYSPGLKAFGLGCIKKELVDSEEVITSSFKLVDEVEFQQLGKPVVLDASATLEMVESVIRAQLPDSAGVPTERFIVGTSFLTDEEIIEDGDMRGRILVLGVDSDRQVYQVLSHKLKGSCRCLGVMGNYIVAGLSKTVVVYSYSQETTASGSLHKMAAYRTSSYPIDLDIAGNMIGIVDLMQSLCLVEFVPPQEGTEAKLVERGRHHEPTWATSVCHLDGGRWLEADAQGNLMVLRRNEEAPAERERSRLEVTSDVNIGEQINRIRRLQAVHQENAIVTPKAFLASVEGALYLFGEISPEYQDLLMTFQERLSACLCLLGDKESGKVRFEEWRAFRGQTRTGEGPYRFIDGEMLERFLDLSETEQKSVCEGLGPSMEHLRSMVEELRLMH